MALAVRDVVARPDVCLLWQERVNTNQGFVIHPYSPFRWKWDSLMVVMLALTVISIPVTIAFFRDGVGLPWFVLSCFVDALFFLDIVLNFLTGVVADSCKSKMQTRTPGCGGCCGCFH